MADSSQPHSNGEPSWSFDNSGQVPLQVPGFGLPVNVELNKDLRFAHGVTDATYERLTAREVAMLQLMDALTDKKDWQDKINDETIVGRWREEALCMPCISEKTFDWCLTELRQKAEHTTKYTITLDTASRCVKADGLIPGALQQKLKNQIQPLLEQPKDWHPGSNEQVLDLVHPSLFPLVYGKTRVLQQGRVSLDRFLAAPSEMVVAPQAQDLVPNQTYRDSIVFDDLKRWSTKFQWLPCEVAFAKDKDAKVTITSYINELHPQKHNELYSSIESLIEYSIPAWNEVLLKSKGGRTPLRITTMSAPEEPFTPPIWLEELVRRIRDEKKAADIEMLRKYLKSPEAPLLNEDEVGKWDDGDETSDDDAEKDERHEFIDDTNLVTEEEDDRWLILSIIQGNWIRLRQILHPEPGTPHTFEDWIHGRERKHAEQGYGSNSKSPGHEYYSVDLKSEFLDKGLQIIVKIAGIELTPDNPKYTGGSWHLEGMLNEHVVATSIYYYDVQNTTESRIRFRQEATIDDFNMSYAQDDHEPLCKIFGTDSMRDEPAIQEIGNVATPEGRLLVFPNTLQHKVEPFRLMDASKPGHRRFVVLWLVDPHYRILSTRNVPPQQHHWWVEKAAQDNLANRVPREIQTMIEDQMKSGTMTMEEAKEYRLQLMGERTTFKDAIDQMVEEYNFCEH